MTKKNLYPSLGLASATLLFVSMAAAQNNDAKSSNTPVTPTATSDKVKPAATPKAGAASNTTAHETVEYKDPEDMTTRYRPGNNKTTRTSADPTGALPPTAPTGTLAADADAKKHVSNIKWMDREAGIPACDGASKDAEKCAAAPPAPPATAKPAPPDAQDSKHTGKVDSFTVKQ